MFDPWFSAEDTSPNQKLKKELKESKELRDVTSALREFQKETFQKKKAALFLNFLSLYEGFLVNNIDESITKIIIPKTFPKILDYAEVAAQSIPTLVQSLRLLSLSNKIAQFIPRAKNVIILFNYCCKYALMQPKIMKISDDLFHTLFNDPNFLIDYSNQDGYVSYLKQVLCTGSNDEIIQWSLSIIVDLPNPETFGKIDPSNLLTAFISVSGSDLIPKFSIEGAVTMVIKIIKNGVIYSSSFLQKVISSNVLDYVDKSVEEIGLTDDYILSPFKLRLKIFEMANIKYNNLLLPVCGMLFFYLSNHKLTNKNETIYYDKIFSRIVDLIKNSTFSYAQLYSIGFLDAFVIGLPTEILSGFISSKDNNYTNIVFSIFSLPEAAPKRHYVFSAILKTGTILHFSTSFFVFCTNLLSVSPTPSLVKCILSEAAATHNPTYCDILLSIFVQFSQLSESFIKADGLNWIEESLSTKLLTIEQYSSFLANLVVFRRFDEVDQFIFSLPKDHPIFKLPKSALEKIVYGLNSAKNRPIRVYSLFLYIDGPDYIDPYNAWMLGNCLLDHFLAEEGKSIFDFPYIKDVANRFLHPNHIEYLLERPFSLEQFACLSYDHFPLFQLYQGKDEFKITNNFKSMSFWVKFHGVCESQKPFFRTDYLTISCGENSFVIQMEGKTHRVEVDPLKWTFIFIISEDSFLSSTTTVYIQDVPVFKCPKPLKSDFTFAHFGSYSNNLMFIGPAIRLFNENPTKLSEIISNGPGNIDLIEEFKMETIITPYFFCEPYSTVPNFSMSKLCTIPSTCVTVPYFGFPFHFISMRKNSRLISILNDASTDKEYKALFSTLLNINILIMHDSSGLWDNILGSLKKYKKFVSKEIFLQALKSVAAHKHGDHLLSSILFDSDMWTSVNNEILVQVLFDYFSNTNWLLIENFELFLTTVIMRNPTSTVIVDTILKNYKSLPMILKYILTIFKISHVLDAKTITWDLLVARFEIPVQSTIIESLYNFVNNETVQSLIEVLPFSKIRLFLLVSPNFLAAKVLHLAAKIEKLRKGYIEIDVCLLHRIALLSHIKSVWEDSFLLVTGSSEPKMAVVQNANFIPFLASLIWSLSLCYAHSYAYHGESCESIQQYDEYYDFAVCILQNNVKEVINSEFCIIILRSWFPLVFSYPMLIKTMMEAGNDANSELLILSQLSEARDPTWNGKEQVIKSIKMPPCPLPVGPTVFVVEMMSAVLRNHALDFITQSTVHVNGIGKWLTNSSLSKLIADIILSSPLQLMYNLFLSIFLSVPFYDRIRAVNYVPVILKTLMERFSTLYTPGFPLEQLLKFIQFFVSQKMFQNSADHFIETLLSALEIISNDSKEIQKCSIYINAIILDLIASAPESMFPKITASLSMHAKLFYNIVQARKLQKTWEYIFSILSTVDSPMFCTLMDQFMEYAKPDNKDKFIIRALKNKQLALNTELYSMVEMDWIQNTTEFTQECSKISMTIAAARGFFTADFTNLSHELNRGKYVANCKHYLTAHLFSKKLLCLDGTFSLNEERMHWSQFMLSLRDNASFIASFAPKTYHLCPRCFPFASPRLVSPSPFPLQNMNVPDHRFISPIVELFRKNSKPLFTRQEKNEVSLNELFANCTKAAHGNPIGVFPCKLIRYKTRIRSVLFVFHSVLMILTYATVLPNGLIELRPTDDEKELHIFLESVFLGHWGFTSIFASHVVLNIKLEHMIYSRQHSQKEIEIWTFQNGNFILKIKKRYFSKVFQMLKRYNEKAISQLSSYQFLFKATTSAIAYQQWTNSFLSTDQFILVMNGLASRSFVDLEHFPLFPCVSQIIDGKRKLVFNEGTEDPDSESTIELLQRVLPFTYFHKASCNSISHKLPAILFYTPEFYKDMNKINEGNSNLENISPASYVQIQRDAIEEEKSYKSIVNWTMRLFDTHQSKKAAEDITNGKGKNATNIIGQNHSNIADLELFHVCQRVELTCKSHQIFAFEQGEIRKNRRLSARIESNKPNYVQIDKRTLTLCCFNKITKNIYCSIVEPLLIFASSLSLSVNGMFLVIDFEFGLSRTYRILYSEQTPSSIKMISDFSWSVKPQSSISGVDWIVATAHENHLIIWEVFTGSVHRDIPFEEPIEFVAIDEENGGIYVMTTVNAFYYSINGDQMAKSSFEEPITVVAPLQLHSSDRDRTCVIGCANGHIYLISPRVDQGTIDFKRLPSQHKYPVDRITFNSSLCEFLSIDSKGIAFVWSAIELASPPLKTTVFAHCATCFKKPLYRCSICNRAYCAHCMCDQIRGICSHCASLNSMIGAYTI